MQSSSSACWRSAAASSARSAPSCGWRCRSRATAPVPYPSHLVAQWVDARGERLTIRPVKPEDAPAHAALFRRLSPLDVRFRFFSAMRELSEKQLRRLTNIDYARDMALIAVRESTRETVGVARLAGDQDEHVAEFAVVVDPAMKGRGLATELMRRLIAWARDQGIVEIVGQILADNGTMLAFVRRLGFRLHRMVDADDIVEARLSLAPPPAPPDEAGPPPG